jgi:drug/metabolite transporter (DMT)-like permease
LTDRATHALRIVAAAALFSTAGAAIKSCGLTGIQVTCFRSAVAAVTILVLMPEARRGWTWAAALVSLAYTACMTLFVLSTKLTTAANAIFLQATSPLYILLLGPWLLGERVRRRDLALLAPLALGLGLFFVGIDRPVATAPDPVRGNVLAAGSGLAIALLVVGLRWLASRGRGEAAAAVLMGNVVGFLATLPAAVPVAEPRLADALIIVYLGVFQLGLAYVLVARAIGHVPALEASMLLFIEPVLNPVWAWLVHGEVPGVWARVGGALILGTTAVQTLLEVRRT